MVRLGWPPLGAVLARQVDSGVYADDALVAAARADPQQFALLYERYVGPIYRYCYVQLGSQAAAEDATSEVFLKALAGLGGFRGGSVAAWLLKIARNTIIDLHRRRRPASPIEHAEAVADPGETPEGAAMGNARREALRRALAGLPEDQRTVIVLQLAGWSGEQIAGAMGKRPSAVYMLRVRALKRMQKTLRAAGWDPEESGDERA